MGDQEVLEDRKKRLLDILERSAKAYKWRDRRSYIAAVVVMTGAVTSSVALGILGVLLQDDNSEATKKTIGVIALLPAAFTLIATAYRPQQRANWHYRKAEELSALYRRLDYECPVNADLASIAEVSKAYAILERNMSLQWENELAIDTDPLKSGKAHHKGQPAK
jgi:hypothetical protein